MPDALGIHHVTAIAGDPQRNADFYAAVLGLRLVKRTVNFDDPGTYHLYFGDELGRPGSILTFFPWPDGVRGRQGTGQTAAVALAVPPDSIGYWVGRLVAHGVAYTGPDRRFGQPAIAFDDPDGLPLELVGDPRATTVAAWAEGPVPAEHAVRYIHGVTIWVDGDPGSAALLEAALGYRRTEEEDARVRYEAGKGSGAVDLRRATGFWRATGGVGTVHHVAFRAEDGAAQLALRERIAGLGAAVTPVVDRQYFESIYFREPGGVLFEVATDAPGFATDEPADRLGTSLKLPPWLEPSREEIERILPPLYAPAPAAR
jgi:catechol 2,3-dioxygenase-like lactoylglutathione lyase family enzyme